MKVPFIVFALSLARYTYAQFDPFYDDPVSHCAVWRVILKELRTQSIPHKISPVCYTLLCSVVGKGPQFGTESFILTTFALSKVF